MLKNYFQIAVRNLKKDRVFSFINIAGLAVGITCFIALSLYIIDELSYDRYNKNADQIYRIIVKQNINGIENTNSKTPGPLGPTLLSQLPETISFTRIGYFGQYRLRYKDKVFNEGNIYAVDSSFFDVFTLLFIEGNPKTALTRPNTMVITESAAKKYFGNENPVGKTLIIERSFKADYLNQEKNYIDRSENFLITGLIKDFPKNSHFRCNFLSSTSTYEINNYWLDLWYSTYVVLKKGTDPAEYEKKLEKIVYQNVGPLAKSILGVSLEDFIKSGNTYSYRLQPLTSIYLYSQKEYGVDLNTEWGDIKNSDITYIYIFSAIAFFILIIAVINFMNLATARSERRSKEVGIRKTLGSNKFKLILQFVSEAIVMSFLSVLVALALLEIILPSFNSLIGKELKLSFFNNFYTIPLIIAFILFVGILAGSYPAFYLSSFQPVQVLKSNSAKGSRKSNIRSGLVIMQFAISITLLIGTIIIKNQLDYIQNKNLGFKKEHLFSIMNGGVLGKNVNSFKQELIKNSKILSVTNSSQMFRAGIPGNGYLYNKKYGTDPTGCQFVDVDYDFLKTYQIKLKEGRFFSKAFSTDTSSVAINETAENVFRDKNPVGKEITRIGRKEWKKTFKIIGVIKDFNYESLYYSIRPLILHLNSPTQADNYLTIRIAPGETKETIEYIKETWDKFSDGNDMYSRFVDENIARLYASEQNTSIITTVFSLLAILIASLGVFGLSAFVAEQRTKEIGIRKALGASITEIILLLTREFAVWVLMANLIAWPVAYYIMNSWLKNFAYRVNLNLGVFVLAAIIALIIALSTISFQTIKAARANPVESLKYE
jgi:putative ABC transport system permease protein